MNSRTLAVLTTAGGLASAVTAVVYVNFSARIMPHFAAHLDPAGMRRMQAFNRTAVQPPFMLCFFGAALVGVLLIGRVLLGRQRGLLDLVAAAGGGLYLAGLLLTIAVNVPLNDRLARMDADAPGAMAFWRHYLEAWTAANTVRAGLSIGATLLLLGAAAGIMLRSSNPSQSIANPDVLAVANARVGAR